MNYEKPELKSLGTLHELTLSGNNKVGPNPDIFSNVVPIIGSIVPGP